MGYFFSLTFGFVLDGTPFVIRFLFSLSIIISSRFFPGEGKRALRFHDLSRRAKRVVGRSDAVLHHFGEAKPSRNGCIVVRPMTLKAVAPILKTLNERNEIKLLFPL